MQNVNVILFDDFTTLDALGPAEILSRPKECYTVQYYSVRGGLIHSSAGAQINTQEIQHIQHHDILLIPGGFGTRKLVDNPSFIGQLETLARQSRYVLSICTAAALLARTTCLNGKTATSNKKSWDWVTAQNAQVHWKKAARWVVDGKYYTSSGITAGMDMALGFIADHHGYATARDISNALEYLWNENKDSDPFA